MTARHGRPAAAASEPADPSEGAGAGEQAVDALARILDPWAFEPAAKPRDVSRELHRKDRALHAIVCATRAVAAGYRPVVVGGSREDLAALAHATGRLAPGTPIREIPSPYTFIDIAVDAIWAAGYRLVSEELGWYPLHDHDGLRHSHHRHNDGHGSHEHVPLMTREEAEMTWTQSGGEESG